MDLSLRAGDQTTVDGVGPERQQSSSEAMASAWKKKIMMTAFFDQKGVVTLDFLEESSTINSDRYCESLRMMKSAYQNKQRGQSSTLISLLHHNATSHVSKKTREVLNHLSINVIEHPPYSPDLSPCDFFLFGRLKKMIRGAVSKIEKSWKMR